MANIALLFMGLFSADDLMVGIDKYIGNKEHDQNNIQSWEMSREGKGN